MAVAIIVFAAALPVGDGYVKEPYWPGEDPCLPGLTLETLVEESDRSKIHATRDFPTFCAVIAFLVSLSGIMKFEFERLFWPILLPVGLVISILGRGTEFAGNLRKWPEGLPFIWEQAAALTLIVLLWRVPVKDELVLSPKRRDGKRQAAV